MRAEPVRASRGDELRGLYLGLVQGIRRKAHMRPSAGAVQVFLIADADYLVPQEASPEAANALLKLLEEPPAGARFILTSSEPGSLLPTIRSRVVSVRVPPLPEATIRRFIADEVARAALPNEQPEDLLRMANGAPGTLSGASDRSAAVQRARQLLQPADAGREQALRDSC